MYILSIAFAFHLSFYLAEILGRKRFIFYSLTQRVLSIMEVWGAAHDGRNMPGMFISIQTEKQRVE